VIAHNNEIILFSPLDFFFSPESNPLFEIHFFPLVDEIYAFIIIILYQFFNWKNYVISFQTNKAKQVGQDSLVNDQLVNKETNIAESITEE